MTSKWLSCQGAPSLKELLHAANKQKNQFLIRLLFLQVAEAVPTRYRSERESVPKYLFSRSVAGTNHRDLIDAVDRLYAGQIYARFFPMFPPRKLNLSRWLRDWINVGAIPVATLNLQRGPVRPGQTIPDAWHHQVNFYLQPFKLSLYDISELM